MAFHRYRHNKVTASTVRSCTAIFVLACVLSLSLGGIPFNAFAADSSVCSITPAGFGSAQSTDSADVVIPLSVLALTNRAAIVVVHSSDGSTPASVTFGGVTMLAVGNQEGNWKSAGRIFLYTLADPPAGIATVLITKSSSTLTAALAMVYGGVAASSLPESFISGVSTNGQYYSSFEASSPTQSADSFLVSLWQVFNANGDGEQADSPIFKRAVEGWAGAGGANWLAGYDRGPLTHPSTQTVTERTPGRPGTFAYMQVTLAADVIDCTTPDPDSVSSSAGSGAGPRTGTINVVKRIINDSGGTKTISDFPLFVNGALVSSGATNNFAAPVNAYAITETADALYTQTFSGDCDSTGHINLQPDSNTFCVITNDDKGSPAVAPIPPLIDVVKVPSPLALPGGAGPVMYTYTLRNVGTVPVSGITMVGDTCSPIVFVFGDSNADAKLDVGETWTYRCSTVLSETHTNTVVATGHANGLTAVDAASATVVVGAPIVPPLINVIKVPSTLTLPLGGGAVTYTKSVSNPGTVALSNVLVTDDQCSPVTYISGDTNNDARLDITETWTYTCQANLSATITNTASASGQANGLTARDFAIATVIVAVPGFPNTGLPPGRNNTPWGIVMLIGAVIAGAAACRKVFKQ